MSHILQTDAMIVTHGNELTALARVIERPMLLTVTICVKSIPQEATLERVTPHEEDEKVITPADRKINDGTMGDIEDRTAKRSSQEATLAPVTVQEENEKVIGPVDSRNNDGTTGDIEGRTAKDEAI